MLYSSYPVRWHDIALSSLLAAFYARLYIVSVRRIVKDENRPCKIVLLTRVASRAVRGRECYKARFG